MVVWFLLIKFFMINTLNSLEIFGHWGGSGDGERNLIMFLAPENKIIIMGFKGSGSVFDNIFDEFRNPRTLRII